MPALKVVHGDSSRPGPGEGLPFDRLPISARRDERLTDGAKLQLASIVPKEGAWPNFVVMSDAAISRETGHSTATVQRHWLELESAGWVKRHRRSNVRKIFLLFDLANGRTRSMQSSQASNALIADEKCTPRILSMHSPSLSSQYLRGEETEDPEKGRAVATIPREGGPPPPRPAVEEKDPDLATGKQLDEIESMARSGVPALRRLGETALARHRAAEARANSRRDRRSDLADPTTADLLTDQERADARKVVDNPESHELAVSVALMSLSQDRRARAIIASGGVLPDKKTAPGGGRQPFTPGRSEGQNTGNSSKIGPNNQGE